MSRIRPAQRPTCSFAILLRRSSRLELSDSFSISSIAELPSTSPLADSTSAACAPRSAAASASASAAAAVAAASCSSRCRTALFSALTSADICAILMSRAATVLCSATILVSASLMAACISPRKYRLSTSVSLATLRAAAASPIAALTASPKAPTSL